MAEGVGGGADRLVLGAAILRGQIPLLVRRLQTGGVVTVRPEGDGTDHLVTPCRVPRDKRAGSGWVVRTYLPWVVCRV